MLSLLLLGAVPAAGQETFAYTYTARTWKLELGSNGRWVRETPGELWSDWLKPEQMAELLAGLEARCAGLSASADGPLRKVGPGTVERPSPLVCFASSTPVTLVLGGEPGALRAVEEYLAGLPLNRPEGSSCAWALTRRSTHAQDELLFTLDSSGLATWETRDKVRHRPSADRSDLRVRLSPWAMMLARREMESLVSRDDLNHEPGCGCGTPQRFPYDLPAVRPPSYQISDGVRTREVPECRLRGLLMAVACERPPLPGESACPT